MKQLIKSELIAELQADTTKGIAYNQSGIPLQVMTFREFLDWYDDKGYDRYEVIEVETDESFVYRLVRSLRNGRGGIDSQEFESEQEAQDEYYKVMEGRYNDDNGSGGIFHTNVEAIARLSDPSDEWQLLFPIPAGWDVL